MLDNKTAYPRPRKSEQTRIKLCACPFGYRSRILEGSILSGNEATMTANKEENNSFPLLCSERLKSRLMLKTSQIETHLY